MRSVLFATALTASASLFAAGAKAVTSCSPRDNAARILASPSPNKVHRDWRGGDFVSKGWSFTPKTAVSNITGVYLRGDLRGSRGGVANRRVYILLREWDCDGPLPDGVPAPPATAQASPEVPPLPQTAAAGDQCVSAEAPPAGPADTAPAEKVRDVYTRLQNNTMDDDHNPISLAKPSLAASFFTLEFLDLWANDQKCWAGDGTEGAAKMWIGGQDSRISDVTISVDDATAGTQNVVAKFKNFDQPQTWTYKFKKGGTGWLAEDVLEDGRSLSEAMRGGCVR
jgi:hypothetical protein